MLRKQDEHRQERKEDEQQKRRKVDDRRPHVEDGKRGLDLSENGTGRAQKRRREDDEVDHMVTNAVYLNELEVNDETEDVDADGSLPGEWLGSSPRSDGTTVKIMERIDMVEYVPI